MVKKTLLLLWSVLNLNAKTSAYTRGETALFPICVSAQ